MDAVEAELRRVAALEAELRAADEQVEYWRVRELRAAATEAESRRPAVAAPPRPPSVEPEPEPVPAPPSEFSETLRTLRQEREQREQPGPSPLSWREDEAAFANVRGGTFAGGGALLEVERPPPGEEEHSSSSSEAGDEAMRELRELEAALREETARADAAERELKAAAATTAEKRQGIETLRGAVEAEAAALGSPSPVPPRSPPRPVEADLIEALDRALAEAASDSPASRLWMRLGSETSDSLSDGADAVVKVVSYNLLADHLATPPDRIERYLWESCPPHAVSWEHRLELLLAELRGYDADVLCLQEVQRQHFEEHLQPRLRELGYDGAYAPRNVPAALTPEKRALGRAPDGVAIFYRRARMELVETEGVVYREGECDAPAGSELAAGLAGAEGGALLARLRVVGSAAQLVAVSTHLWHEPSRPDVRLAQAQVLTTALRAFVQRAGPSTGVVLGGDFNSEPDSGVYELLSRGCLEAGHPDHPSARGTAEMGAMRCAQFESANALSPQFGDAQPRHTPRHNLSTASASAERIRLLE